MWAQFDGEHVAGAAKRRRERRHRAYLKYVRASTIPHEVRIWTGPGEEYETQYTAKFRKLSSPKSPAHFTLDDDDSLPELGGSRPDRIATLSGPQERDLRCTVQQIVDTVPLVPLLDDPVPQTVEQLPDVMRFFDMLLPVPEQVIEVPKILLYDVPARPVLRDPQLAEAGGSADDWLLLLAAATKGAER